MLGFFKKRFSKIKEALAKTRAAITGKIRTFFKGNWDEEAFETLEQILYEADLGSDCAVELVEQTRIYLKKHKDAGLDEVLEHLHAKSLEMLEVEAQVEKGEALGGKPKVLLVVGVNGSGKTTTIAKLANLLKEDGQKVMVAAGDTFRAAAIEQLETWADRLEIPIIRSQPGGDPAAVAFDAAVAARARGIDTLIIDTAGRLQNKTELMQELEKVHKVLKKEIPSAPHETLLVIDATMGQNGVDQAATFHQFTPLTGIIVSKLDGSAKGGIILSIYKKLGIPVEWVGVGEKIDDLIPFDKVAYIDALFKS